MTEQGNIIVDGIVASCYAFSDHDLAHIGMTPFQLFPEIIGWMFGGDKEFSLYVNIVKDIGGLVLPANYELGTK